MPSTSFSAWTDQHRRSLNSAIVDLLRNPTATLMTLTVIAIALALPATLLTLLGLGQHLSQDLNEEQSITLYLNSGIDAEAALILSASLEDKPGISATRLLTSGDALEEFREYSGFGDTLDALDENPLPNLIVLQLTEPINEAVLSDLLLDLETLPETELVDYDQEWIQRLERIMETSRRLVLALGVAFGVAVIMIIGNTIRLEILNRRSEIEIARLVGGTGSFIRRPFLYTGLLYGSAGAFMAWLLVAMLLLFLQGPIADLERLYSTQVPLAAFELLRLLILAITGALLGLAGAWLAVGRQLAAIQPK